MPTLPNFPLATFDRFDPTLNYKRWLYRSARGLQSPELNETQDAVTYERQTFLNATYGDGAMIAGGIIAYINTTGTTAHWIAAAGTFYALGFLYQLPSATFNIAQVGDPTFPLGETDSYGVIIHVDVVDEYGDVNLRDPAPGTKNYGEGGSARMRYAARFGKQSTALAGDWYYHRIDFVNGLPVVVDNSDDGTNFRDLIARYDRNANGNYIVRGNYVSFVGNDTVNSLHRVQISAGQSNVFGYEQVLDFPYNLTTPYAAGTKQVFAEPLTFTANGVYTLRYSPLAVIGPQVNGIIETTATVTHGAFHGAIDQLPNTPVVSVSAISQAARVFVSGVDYAQSGDRVAWLSGGNEPSPGSSYVVTFRYSAILAPTITSDRTGINLSGLAPATVVYVDYQFYVPRYDVVVINQGLLIYIIQGVPSPTPVPPVASSGLVLATLYVSFGFPPRITNSDQRRPLTADLVTVQHSIDDIKFNLARLNLNDRLRTSDPVTLMKGIFTDPMVDNTYRDAGIAQTAEIASGICYMAVPFMTVPLTVGTTLSPKTILPYTTAILVENLAHTTAFQINAFVGVTPPPSSIVTWPPQITWIDSEITNYVHASPYYVPYWAIGGVPPGIPYPGPPGSPLNVLGDVRIIATTVTETMITTPVLVPPTVIHFLGGLYNYNELVNVSFDNAMVGTTTADGTGMIGGQFTTPSTALSGAKRITFTGQVSGVVGVSSFTAIPFAKATTGYLEQLVYYDPLAETYGPTPQAFVADVQAWVIRDPARLTTATDFIDCMLLETEIGLPDRSKTVATTRLYNAAIPDATAGSHVPAIFTFSQPVATSAEKQYAFVLATPQPSYSAWGCTLGQFDTTHGRWISAKPTTGTLLESSNSATWLPRLMDDLTYVVDNAIFSLTRTVVYPTISVTGATDLILLANVDIPNGTSVKFTVTLTVGGQAVIYPISPNAPVSIPLYTGMVTVTGYLATTNNFLTPAIDPLVSLGVATVVNPSNYVSRAILVGANASATVTTLKVYLEIYEPDPNTVLVEYLAADGVTWVAFTRDVLHAVSVGFGIVDMPFTTSNTAMVGVAQSRLRVTLSSLDSTLLRRAYCRNLRMFFA